MTKGHIFGRISAANPKIRKNCKNPKKGLDKPVLLVYNKLVKIRHAPIAQLDRVFGYEPKGRGFESLLACQKTV